MEITIMKKEPFKSPSILVIDNDLKELQKAVNGYIETVPFINDTVLICNEEGKLRLDCNANFFIPENNIDGVRDCIMGTALFAGRKRDKFCSLSNPQITAIYNYFREAEQ